MPIHEMTQAAYGRHRGVTAKAIEKAIDAGRIPAGAVRRVGRSKLIDVAAADLALGQPALRVNTPPEIEDLPAAPGTAAAPRETPALTVARTTQAEIAARLAQLDYDRRVGKLLEADDVARSMTMCAEMIVRDIDQIPVRADDLVTAYTRGGVAAVRALLKVIARGMRETLANNMRLLTEADVDDDAADDAAPDTAAPIQAVADAGALITT